MQNIKCVVIGDGAVGKTSMLIAYTSGTFPKDYVPTVFDNYESTVKLPQVGEVYLGLWDTAGQEGYDRLRPLSYPQTDVFLICFSVNSPVSFKHVETKWKPEIMHHSPQTPFMVVGTKSDIRDDRKVVEALEAKGKPLRSFERNRDDARAMGAASYLECSALEQSGLSEVFEEAIRVAMRAKAGTLKRPGKSGKAKDKKKGDCVLL